MRYYGGCAWCHETNELTPERDTIHWQPATCHSCGHRGDVARMKCDCARCRSGGPGSGILPLDLADRSSEMTPAESAEFDAAVARMRAWDAADVARD
jgi:hypothetical protein